MAGASMDPNKSAADRIPKTGVPEFDNLNPAAKCLKLNVGTKDGLMLSGPMSVDQVRNYRDEYNRLAVACDEALINDSRSDAHRDNIRRRRNETERAIDDKMAEAVERENYDKSILGTVDAFVNRGKLPF